MYNCGTRTRDLTAGEHSVSLPLLHALTYVKLRENHVFNWILGVQIQNFQKISRFFDRLAHLPGVLGKLGYRSVTGFTDR